MMQLLLIFIQCLILMLSHTVTAFIAGSVTYHVSSNKPWYSAPVSVSALFSSSSRRTSENDGHRLLQEFSIASGEVINPYEVLKVSRKATREEIRASYIKQSRRYHPDGYRNKSSQILPGSCNNWDDVRNQWERIKLSYEILSNPKTRKRYDRHYVLSDPNAAIQRAMMDATLGGITNVGKGIFGVGSFAIKAILTKNTDTGSKV